MADNNTNELDALMISELPTQATANETDLFEVAIVDANSASGYASKKESAAAIADAIVGEYQYPLRITGTAAKTIAGAINELKNLVDLLPQFAIEVVQTLPVSDISETTIYLVPTSDPEQGNYYEEYIYVNNAWELVGTTAVDLTGYYTSAQVDTLLAAKADTSSLATVATSGAYSDLSGKPTIDTALDNTSTNAVENRAVAGEINSIKSDITVEGSASGDIATFVDGSDNPLKELKISIVAQQSGSGDPSPTNIRPISGFNAVNVGDISDAEKLQYFKGLLDGTYGFVDLGELEYSYKPTGYNSKPFLAVLPNAKLGATSAVIVPAYCTCLEQVAPNSLNSASVDKVFGISHYFSGYHELNIIDNDYSDTTSFKTAMQGQKLIYELATPTTPTITTAQFATLISAFGLQGWLVQITMPSEAGTVYGAMVDILTGKLSVTHEIADLGNLNWILLNEKFHANLGEHKQYSNTAVPDILCSVYKTLSAVDVANKVEAGITLGNIGYWGIREVGAYDPSYVDAETFKTAVTGQKLVYPLATPIEYDLTPQQINSLLGINNIFANCGSITELKYTRDLNLCINDIIARIEALEGGSNTRSLSVSPNLTKSLTSDSDTAEDKTEETEEETKEEAQKNER